MKNFSTAISLRTPFASALTGLITAISAKAGWLLALAGGLGGFIAGFCFGALSVGLSGVVLDVANRCRSGICVVSLGVVYLVLSPIFLVGACLTAHWGVRLFF
jgi:hypothetical protein